MRLIVAAVVMLTVWSGAGVAQAPRDVMLDVCNDTGFAVAVSVTYGTDPTDARTLRSWFVVQPASCLDGALNNVVGDSVEMHVMSGQWVWPSGVGDTRYCVPANSSFSRAAQAPCNSVSRERAFRRIDVVATSQRVRGGGYLGRASYRIRCADLPANDVGLCPLAPRDDRGFALPVRELEVCNNGRRDSEVTALVPLPTGRMEGDQMRVLGRDECAVIYRGFPHQDQVLLVGPLDDHSLGDGVVCLHYDADGVIQTAVEKPDGENCPAHASHEARYRPVLFGQHTHRFTTYVAG
jgi:uncharacterized membrane protein